ncbi:MAG: NAD-dependent epimerase/dehydratase family protein [bacterium]
MNILITGGAGFIGSRLANQLKENNKISVLDNFLEQVHGPDGQPNEFLDGVDIIRGDVRDEKTVFDAIQATNPEIIYHLASETGTGQSFDEPSRYNAVNVMGTSHLVEGVRQHGPNVSRIILAGSRSVYGEGACVDKNNNPTMAVERSATDMKKGDFLPKSVDGRVLTPVPSSAKTPVAPASIYASTKLFQEYLLRQAFWGTDIDVGILRLQNVYGAGQSLNNPYTGVISIFTNQIREGKTLNIYEDGIITRDFVYVDDVVNAFSQIGLIDDCPEEIIDIGSGEAATILDMAKSLLRKLGEPEDKYNITGDFRAGDIRYAVADINDAEKLLGWRPQITLDQGLDKFLAWATKA